MAYEDFKINENAIEEMAKEFHAVNVLQEEGNEAENISENESLIYDIFSGFKILERLVFFSKMQTKNQKLLNFMHDSETNIQNVWQILLKIKNDVVLGEIDFEMPQNDQQVIKLVQNILTSLLLNLLEFFEIADEKQGVVKIITQLAQILKSSLNF